MTERAQHARLADAGLADEHDGCALVERFDQRLDDRELGLLGSQSSASANLLGERRVGEARSARGTATCMLMPLVLGIAVARRAAGELVEQRARWVERDLGPKAAVARAACDASCRQ